MTSFAGLDVRKPLKRFVQPYHFRDSSGQSPFGQIETTCGSKGFNKVSFVAGGEGQGKIVKSLLWTLTDRLDD